ncbi:unnamed protein product [Effrenium voratum]|nr:unnamed protein product [Effrenium voratum]
MGFRLSFATRRSSASQVLARRLYSSFAGLKHEARLVQQPEFHRSGQELPVLRLVGENGRLVPGADMPCDMATYLAMYKSMVTVAVVDQVMNSLQRQGRISFYMTGTGEEAAQVGTAARLGRRDVIWAQYRELGTYLYRGFTIQQMVDQCLSRGDEPGKGRQMPVHYCDASLGLQAISSPLGTQIPHAVGAGYAFRISGQPRVGVTYFGDGAASEGDFAVALNFAATLKAQTLFICRNNGWAISTPSREQYAGDGIAVRGIAYGMPSLRVDGNDLAAVYLATEKARELCLEGQPVLLELMTYRRGHHSTSDDAGRYRDNRQVRPGQEQPVPRARRLLEEAGEWDEQRDQDLRHQLREELMEALKTAEAKTFGKVSDMFEDRGKNGKHHLFGSFARGGGAAMAWRVLLLASGAAGSLLHVAAGKGNVSEVAELLDRRGLLPWINHRAVEGDTPVMAASLAGQAEVVELLIQRGCNVTIADKDGYKPLDAAAAHGHSEVVSVLMKYSPPSKTLHTFHRDGFAPLHRACWGNSHEHSQVVQTLLRVNVDPVLPASNGSTCLQLASRQETRDILAAHCGSFASCASEASADQPSSAARAEL